MENEDHRCNNINEETQHQHGGPSSSYDTWYSLSELDDIKESVKEEAKKYRILSSKAISSSPTQSSLVLPFRNCGVYKKMKYLVKVQQILNDDAARKNVPEFRGLEGRIFVERQRNKTMAMTTVLEYQRRTQILIDEARKNNKSEADITTMKEQFATRLSTICSQLSQWAIDEALAAARYDAEGVFALPCNQPPSGNNENELVQLVEKAGYCSGAKAVYSSTSSKRKLSSITDSDNTSTWGQQLRHEKQPRLAMDNVYVSI